MKKTTVFFLTCGVLAWFGSRPAAAAGDFQDHFDQATLQPAWQSAICVANNTYPTDWSVEDGILRGYWSTHYGQQHLTVQGPTDPCVVQVRCRLDRAEHEQSSAVLVLKAEDPAIKHPGVGAANFYACGIGNGKFVFGRVFASGGYDFPSLSDHPELKDGTWHTLKAQINGSHIQCFLDDEMVFETTDNSFTGNHYGVGAALYADVSFDDFQIATLPAGRPAATSRVVATGQLIDTASQETVTFMVVADPADTDPAHPAPARATVVMDSPAIQKLFGSSLVLQGAPDVYVENGPSTQDAKPEKQLQFKTADKLFTVGFNDKSQPGDNPDPSLADWVSLQVTDAASGHQLLLIKGALSSGDVMDYSPAGNSQPVAPALSASTVMRVSWPYSLTSYSLEGAGALDGNWQPVDSWVIDQGGEHQVFLPTTSPMKFFRLVETK